MSDDADDKPPPLHVVSDNSSSLGDRKIELARRRAMRSFAELAATMLRTMAGSEAASYDLMHRIVQLIDAQNELHKLSGD